MKKKIIISLLLVIIAIVVIRGVQNKSKNTPKLANNQLEESIPVSVITVKEDDIKDLLSLTGNILPNAQVTVFSLVPGEVEKIFVKEGDYVRKGEVLARIDYERISLALEQAKAAYELGKVSLDAAEKEYNRMKGLYQKGSISEQQMDGIETRYRQAKAQYDQLKAAYELAKVQANDAQIKAPINGIIAKKFLDEGEIIVASSMMKNSPLVTIVDMDKVKISAYVIEKKLAQLRLGLPANIKVDAYPDRSFIGSITRISPIIEPTSRSFEIEITIDNPDRLLKPGMFAKVEIILQEKTNVPVINLDALNREDGNIFVFKVEKDVVKKVPIQLGITVENRGEVVSGLGVGDKVVLIGRQRLKDNSKVKVVEEVSI